MSELQNNPDFVKMIQQHPELSGLTDTIFSTVELICDAYRTGGQILLCGNGGSAADCGHIVGEMVKAFALPRLMPEAHRAKLQDTGASDWSSMADRLQQGIRAIDLTQQTALISAINNDLGADLVYAQQVYAYGKPGDVLIGFSTSGRSVNVLNAFTVAQAFGLSTVGFTGSRPSPFDEICDQIIGVPAEQTYEIQNLHMVIYHVICLLVEQTLFGEQKVVSSA